MNLFRMSAMSLVPGKDNNTFQYYIVCFVQCWGFLEKFQNSLLVLLCWSTCNREFLPSFAQWQYIRGAIIANWEFLQLSPRWKYSEFSEAACVIENVRGTSVVKGENQWSPAGPVTHRVLQLYLYEQVLLCPGSSCNWYFVSWCLMGVLHLKLRHVSVRSFM